MANKIFETLKDVKRNFLNYKKVGALHHQLQNDYKSPKVNLGQLQATENAKKEHIESLSEVEFQVFSQFGDDGIIQWLVQKLPLANKTFIEFGVENYRESNTRFLLINNYWSGLVIDGSKENVEMIKSEQIHTFYDLQAVCSFITTDNINSIIGTARFMPQVGILNVDIDGNDYWVLKAIDSIDPVIIICEYNSLFGFEHPYTIEYKADFVRGTNLPFQFYGTSLKSAYDLTKARGYTFIGCNSAGNNAYFIKNEFLKHLPVAAKTLADGYNFASFTEVYHDGSGQWLRGIDKIRSINNLPVFNTETHQVEKVDAEAIIKSLTKNNKLNRF